MSKYKYFDKAAADLIKQRPEATDAVVYDFCTSSQEGFLLNDPTKGDVDNFILQGKPWMTLDIAEDILRDCWFEADDWHTLIKELVIRFDAGTSAYPSIDKVVAALKDKHPNINRESVRDYHAWINAENIVEELNAHELKELVLAGLHVTMEEVEGWVLPMVTEKEEWDEHIENIDSYLMPQYSED